MIFTRSIAAARSYHAFCGVGVCLLLVEKAPISHFSRIQYILCRRLPLGEVVVPGRRCTMICCRSRRNTKFKRVVIRQHALFATGLGQSEIATLVGWFAPAGTWLEMFLRNSQSIRLG